MQRKLSQWATDDPTKRFVDLYSLLCNEVWLRVAANDTLRNKGSETAGVDDMTQSNFLGDYDGHINRLRERLKAKTFEPMPVRRVYIPKPNSKKKRPLGIPTLLDRIVQEALRMILEPIWEADFSHHSYGFRPNRSTYDAIAYIGNRLASPGVESYQWVIEGDIASYFDAIPHRRLIKAVKKRVADRNIRDLLWKFPHSTRFSGEAPTPFVIPLQLCSLTPILGHPLHRPSDLRMTHAKHHPPDPRKPDYHG
jgi:RNA-directed DNA polymerase